MALDKNGIAKRIAKEVKDRLMSVSKETVQTKNVSLREAGDKKGSCC